MVIVLLIALVVLALAGAAAILAGLRSLQQRSDEARDEAVRAAVEAATASLVASSAGEREATVRAAVDTVIQVAGEKFADQRGAAERELDLRSRNIAEQVSGLNQSFEQRVSGFNEVFEHQLSGMHRELARVGELVTDLQRDRAAQHGQVVESIEQAVRQTASLSEITQGLREVLASSRARGQWGERMADDVLRSAGLVEGINYRRQVQLPGGTRPDVTFLMPNERVLHMDVKFPIDNYVKYLEACDPTGNPAAADGFRQQFSRDVRSRIKEVTTRDYTDPETTVGYVLLFIPNESVYGFLHQSDPGLVDVALAQGVVLCSPFTLFAVLGVVRQAVETVQLQRTSDEILQCLGSFTTQWTKFSDQLDLLGRRFDSAQKAYDDLAGTRRRVLQKSLDQVDRLRESRRAVGGPTAVGELEHPADESGEPERWRTTAERFEAADDPYDPVDADGAMGTGAVGVVGAVGGAGAGAVPGPEGRGHPAEVADVVERRPLAAGSEHDQPPPPYGAPAAPGSRVPRLRPIRGR